MRVPKNPVARGIVPVVAALALVGGGWGLGRLTASAQEGLKPQTAQQLLVAVENARLQGLSGTVVEHASLGLPALPDRSSSDLSSLVSGSHTLRVWLSAPDRARVALLGTLGESDVVRNGKDLWVWSSRTRTATHYPVSQANDRARAGLPGPATGTTPQSAARQLLRAVDPTTRVETSGTASVAGRPAYELVLTPRDSGSLIGQVRIAVDGATHVPLRVQVLARDAATPAFEVGYTQFDPTRPDAARFDFTPPPGARVVQAGSVGPRRHERSGARSVQPKPELRVVGQGWTSVLVGKASGLTAAEGQTSGQLPGQLTRVLTSLPRVSGTWGTGRLLRGTLFSVLLTDDGRVAVGAVSPERLYTALARP